MKSTLDEIYKTHKDHNLAFRQSVVSSMGILTDQVQLNCRDVKIPCAIYSSSMVGAKIIAKLNKSFLNNLKLACNIVVMRINYINDESKKELPFFVNSKIVKFKKFSIDKPDIYYISIEYVNKAPDELISILGNHFMKQLHFEKRAVQRFVLNPLLTENSNVMEQFLFKAGNGKKCILTEVSLFSAKVIISGNVDEYIKGDTVLLIIKSTIINGLGEMMGNISNVESINKEDGLFSVVIMFDQDAIPPAYKLWLAECIEVIKPDQPHLTYQRI